MSVSEQVGLLRSAYAAFAAGELGTVLELLDPEIEWVEPEAEGLPTPGTWRGAGTVASEVLAAIPEHWERYELRPEDYISSGDTVVVVGETTARGGNGGEELSWYFAHVWRFRDGKAVRFRNIEDTASVLRSLGRAASG